MKKEEKNYLRVIKKNCVPYYNSKVGKITFKDLEFSEDLPKLKELDGPKNGYRIGKYQTPAFLKSLPY